MTAIAIRPLEQVDHADWRRLWSAYLDFYKTKLPEEVYATTWERLFSDGEFGVWVQCPPDRQRDVAGTLQRLGAAEVRGEA